MTGFYRSAAVVIEVRPVHASMVGFVGGFTPNRIRSFCYVHFSQGIIDLTLCPVVVEFFFLGRNIFQITIDKGCKCRICRITDWSPLTNRRDLRRIRYTFLTAPTAAARLTYCISVAPPVKPSPGITWYFSLFVILASKT